MRWPRSIGLAAVSEGWRRWRLARQERQLPWQVVPRWLLLLLILTLSLQWLDGSFWRPAPQAVARPLPAPPPSAAALSLLAAGDTALAQRVGLIWLQSFDTQPGIQLAVRSLDSRRLARWLDLFHALDPKSDYPLMLAANIYLHWGDELRRELLVPWIEARFLEAPNRRWRFLAYPAVLLRRQDDTLPIARRWARLLREHATQAPSWARQLEAFIAAAVGDDAAAYALLLLMLRDGIYQDEAEKRFLLEKLQELSEKLGHTQSSPP